MKLKLTLLLLLVLGFSVAKADSDLKAAFTSSETEKTVYKQGFDSQEELSGWVLTSTNSANSWKLGNPRQSTPPKFSSIDPESVYSLMINYDDYVAQNEEYASPVFSNITSGSRLKFYAAFNGVYSLFAPLTVVVENQENSERKTIFNSFLWSQESGHADTKWLSFDFDLSEYADKNIRIIFVYKGKGGDDVLIDDFRIVEKDNSADAKITINQGQVANFTDLSEGNPTSWLWTFEGGEPATSTEQNPVVKYNTTGTFDVTLSVSNGTENNAVTRTGFVTVQGLGPVAAFDFPKEGYLSPDAAIFIPQNTLVTYTDKSNNFPDEWLWTLPGTTSATYTTQNATVSYLEAGSYGAKLAVKNNQGSDVLDYVAPAVKVGGSAHIWNIGMTESANIDAVGLSWYGYYGGTNWLDMFAFAERYEKPIVKGSVSEIDIYFVYTETVEGSVDITVSVRTEKNGLPGDILGTSVLSSSKLVNDPSTWAPTTFKFDAPIEIDEPFFVVVEGLPNREDDTYKTDKVVMAALRRDNNATATSTVYHYGPDYSSTETGDVWLKNEDDNVSFAIAPLFTYSVIGVGVEPNINEEKSPLVFSDNSNIYVQDIDGSYSVQVYDIAGVLVYSAKELENKTAIDMKGANGIYIVKVDKQNSKWSFKIKL